MDGEGARLNGGRWNAEGVAVVYLSTSLSLAALEYLVHLEIEDAPPDLVAMEFDVPADVMEEAVRPQDLPADWNHVPDHPECVHRGNAWVRSGRTALMRVPSAIVPVETNVLLNPAHEAAHRVRLTSVQFFSFDRRLLG